MDQQELLELIDQAAREGWTELDLSNQGITELPPEIGQLMQLQSLDIQDNRLTALPPEIDQLTELRSLNLSHNPLMVLPPPIIWLTLLQSLNLSNTGLTAHLPQICQLPQLQELDLSSNKLTALPPEVCQLTQLRKLDLDRNKLTTLPPEIGSLSELKSLNLQDNQLTTLPPEIGQLTRLQSLNLYYNQLTALPSEIGSLSELQSLTLSSNRLMSLPLEIVQLTQLQFLELSGNQLTTLPPEIEQFVELRRKIITPDHCAYGDRIIGGIAVWPVLRLDAAVPEQVYLERVFDLAAAVYQLTSPLISEEGLTLVKSGKARLPWDESEPCAHLLIRVTAPECEIVGSNSFTFYLAPGEDSPIFYFHLIPKQLGAISIVVTLYEQDDSLGSTRVRTVACEQVAGQVRLNVNSQPIVNIYYKSQIGVAGDDAKVEGGIRFDSPTQ